MVWDFSSVRGHLEVSLAQGRAGGGDASLPITSHGNEPPMRCLHRPLMMELFI